jgi:hypothetical protein
MMSVITFYQIPYPIVHLLGDSFQNILLTYVSYYDHKQSPKTITYLQTQEWC